MTFTIPFIHKKRYYLLLQIDLSGITCAIARMQRKSLVLESVQQTTCANNEISPMGIANPTKIAHIAQAFLSSQQLGEKTPIICFSSLLNTLASPQQQVLQHLLCLSKISGPVTGLYKGAPITPEDNPPQAVPFIRSELSNLIDVINTPEIKHWQQRLLACIILIITPPLSVISYRFYQSYCLNEITQQEKQLNNYLNKLKPRVQETKGLEQENKILNDHITMIKDLTEEHEIPAQICHTIAKHIPENTWLTTIRIGEKPLNNNANAKQAAKQQAKQILNEALLIKSVPLHIEGKTTNPDEIGIFLADLTSAIPGSTMSIEHITRARAYGEKLEKKPNNNKKV